MTTYWVPFLHAYQPPWQDVEVLKRINKECYEPLFSIMERHKNARITLNIQGCLLEMLEENGLTSTLQRLEALVEAGKIEIVGTAKFHPIIPLIPDHESKRQIRLNEEVLQNYFHLPRPRGFFPPEMAVSPRTCDLVFDQGYEWMIMGGVANADEWPYNYIQESSSGLKTFFRDTYLSNEIAFNKIDAPRFVQKIKGMYEDEHYIITAMDAETFGHHIKFYETSFLGKTFSIIEDEPEIELCFMSNLIGKFPVRKGKDIHASTWSTDGTDLASGVPFPLWHHPLNPMHRYESRMLSALYKLMDTVEEIKQSEKINASFENYYNTARYFYDRALHSCWLWWSSMRPHWSPNLIYKGADLVMKTALNAQLGLINLKIGKGNEFYDIIMSQMEKIMNEMIDQELAGQRVRTF